MSDATEANKVEKTKTETAEAVPQGTAKTTESNEAKPEGSSDKKKKKKKKRTNISKIENYFPKGIYPEGEWMDYHQDFNLDRTTDEEKRYLQRDLENQDHWNEVRKAAEIHRRVRKNVEGKIHPGMRLTEIADLIENTTRKYTDAEDLTKMEDPTSRGIGFPTGLSINEIAAHFTPNKGDKTVLRYEDVMKVDFGVQVNGNIIDSAWTVSFDPQYDNLLTAVREATNTGIKEAGIDVRLTDIGEAIQEVMESYEVEINGETYGVKPCRNLCGHNIAPWRIHGGKSVPIVKNGDITKMEEGEHFAIETFGTTGSGYVTSEGECSHYAQQDYDYELPSLPSTKKLLQTINKNFGTLPFCRRYLDRIGEDDHEIALNYLVKQGYIQDYPPLVDIPGSYTAQYEHTILLHPNKKEIVSKGDDY
ncbi:Methionine aminopeptidase 2 [Maudiozyma exigua]|uniref:Methionine aminopeptidase 2 n=1 Tax=Maudiozyma exigua TaxID=34358 RepID=A0A9P6WAY0_MAUEX|nr:Methionine aminopeptidase 2 [Kazachstania exigua]